MLNFNEMNIRGPNKKDIEDTLKNLNRSKELKQLSLSEKKKMLKEEALKGEFKDQEIKEGTSAVCENALTDTGIENTTEHKPNTNRTQLNTTEHHTEHKLNTTEHNRTQKSEKKRETEHKPNTIPNTTEHNRTQEKKEKLNTAEYISIEMAFKSLTGNPHKAVMTLCSYCIEHWTNKIEETTYIFLASLLKISDRSIKTTMRRLKVLGFFEISSPKGGRGAKITLELNGNLLASYVKFNHMKQQTEHKLNTILNTNVSSSSSFNINNKTTTTSEPDEWTTIQIPPVLKSFNFGEHLVKQIRERGLLTFAELQESLDAFAFDINENDLIKTKKISDPVRYFMSIANKKMQYAPPGNYMSDEQKALEENERRLEQIKQRKEKLERVNAELAYEEWLESLSREERIKLVPENNLLKVGNQFHNQLLRAYFEKTLQNRSSFIDQNSLSQ